MTELNAREMSVLQHLAAAAQAGAPCPTNLDMSKALATSEATIDKAMTMLRKLGHIKATMADGCRTITVVALGKSTAPARPSQMHSRYVQPAIQTVTITDQTAKHLEGLQRLGQRFTDARVRDCPGVPRLMLARCPEMGSRGVSTVYQSKGAA